MARRSLDASINVPGAETSFHLLALDGGVTEALSEVVLGAVSSAVPSISHDWYDNFLVLFVVGKDPFEAIREPEEVLVFTNSAF